MEQSAVSAMTTRDSLINEYQDYARNLVGTLIRQLNLPIVDRDEYLAAAMLGLVEAAERYDPSKSEDFRRFAYFRIKGAVIDAIRDLSEVTGVAYQRLKAAQTVQELSGFLELSSHTPEERLASILEFAAQSALVYRLSLEAREVQNLKSQQVGPEEFAIRRNDISVLRRLIKRLPDLERYVVEQHYLKNREFREMVDIERGLSASWISRLHSRALALLREMYTAETDRDGPKRRSSLSNKREPGSRSKRRALARSKGGK